MNPGSDIRLDFDRRSRIGLDEAILCSGKSPDQIDRIIAACADAGQRMLLTRLSSDTLTALTSASRSRLAYDPVSRTAFLHTPHDRRSSGIIGVVAAGTSDAPVAREAARTLEFYGHIPTEITDVGVAGLWRLTERLSEIRALRVVIAVAGMDAALPTVLGGLIASPIIGVPTSVGYGVATGGTTALNAMLASCSSGLTVVNIDNGFGAACAAIRILNSFPL